MKHKLDYDEVQEYIFECVKSNKKISKYFLSNYTNDVWEYLLDLVDRVGNYSHAKAEIVAQFACDGSAYLTQTILDKFCKFFFNKNYAETIIASYV